MKKRATATRTTAPAAPPTMAPIGMEDFLGVSEEDGSEEEEEVDAAPDPLAVLRLVERLALLVPDGVVPGATKRCS